MRRLVSQSASAAIVLLGLAACRQYLPQNRFLQMRPAPAHTTADARRQFDHARHDPRLAAAGVTCLDCHRFDARVAAAEPAMAAELSARALHPGSAACHFCHGPSAARQAAAPSACTTCHGNLLPLRPADHDLAWDRVHAQMARVEPARCDTCHRQAECIDCHARRDTVRTRVHERNFRFFHGIQATANPMQCGSCHRQDFCIRCHEASRVD
jgi:hypothetical protein